MDRVKREISIMKKVHRSNVVKLHEVMAIKSKIYFAMKYLCDGELFEKVSQGRLKEDSTWNFFKQLVCAVDFCHSHGIYHRDLKPEKLLLDKNGNLKGFDLSPLFEERKKEEEMRFATASRVTERMEKAVEFSVRKSFGLPKKKTKEEGVSACTEEEKKKKEEDQNDAVLTCRRNNRRKQRQKIQTPAVKGFANSANLGAGKVLFIY
ncbi:hypothetical protein HYC85_005519 [Camellia sinensis]|uniref:Protein kinase domain-containing protein n=1 Tax=Camellia sinensis TaxID=4442 RepID=A0A7J7I1N0_CAMSI|nr:hypothetical protein HYC85_005519 [Camellia sinensis]